jgi:mRNA interferase MazF
MGRGSGIARFDVFLVGLDPTVGTEIRKTRPCVVVSPDEMNKALRTIIVAPMTSKGHSYPWRASCRFRGVDGEVVVDQLRTVDRSRMLKRLGKLSPAAAKRTLEILGEMFAP